MKKKKKKQVALDVEETAPEVAAPEPAVAPAPAAAPAAVEEKADSGVATPVEGEAGVPAEDGADLFADLKKKKKKKKELPLDLDTVEAAPASVEGLDVTKKKKSKKAADDFARELDEMDAEDGEAGDLGEGEDDGDDPFARAEGGADGAVDSGKEAWVLEGRDPTYPELLSRFFYLLHQHNPELAGEKRRYTIVPPQVAREGTKKTVFANITDICRRLHRQPEHVIQFLYSELGTQGSIDGAQRLVMKGRYTQKQIENVLRKYITEYVTCKICKSPDTLLGKENRLYFMTCESCGSRRSVSAIKAGFKAQIGKRIKAA
ncbi:eIF-2-beta [Saitozyma sp. JCM 24511]|nr:eIF-2-beta [Saitozyma sp. JCM 24511]